MAQLMLYHPNIYHYYYYGPVIYNVRHIALLCSVSFFLSSSIALNAARTVACTLVELAYIKNERKTMQQDDKRKGGKNDRKESGFVTYIC